MDEWKSEAGEEMIAQYDKWQSLKRDLEEASTSCKLGTTDLSNFRDELGRQIGPLEE
jgi:hypothetical protein